MSEEVEAESALQRAIADACLGAEAGEALARDPRAFFASHGVSPEDIEAVLAAPPRLGVYRSLIRNGLAAVVVRMLPRTRARRNAAQGEGRFEADLAAFLAELGPRTNYLRDVPAELLAWVVPRWRADPAVPPYLVDLARHEIAAFAVAAAAAPDAPRPGEVNLDAPLLFAESVRLERYAWAVHELPPDGEATAEPARRDVCLLAYRDASHAVRWLELTPLAGAVIERLVGGEPLGSAIAGACEEHEAVAAAVLPDVARLLADLGERGVLLGARAG